MSISAKIDIAKWQTQFQRQRGIVVKAVDHTIDTVAKRLYSRVVEYTPIGNPNLWHPPYWPLDYTPGKLKASWKIRKENKEVIISNSQPYALRVEFGWSTQAPEGMLRRAIQEYPILIDRAASEFRV